DALQVLLDRVAPQHALERAVVPGLYGQVQLPAYVRLARHHLDEVRREIVRMRRREPHATDPVDARYRAQELGEPPVRVLPGVDGLPEQRDFGDAAAREAPDLVEDGGGRTVLLGTAHVRHDAVRASVVAAAL